MGRNEDFIYRIPKNLNLLIADIERLAVTKIRGAIMVAKKIYRNGSPQKAKTQRNILKKKIKLSTSYKTMSSWT